MQLFPGKINRRLPTIAVWHPVRGKKANLWGLCNMLAHNCFCASINLLTFRILLIRICMHPHVACSTIDQPNWLNFIGKGEQLMTSSENSSVVISEFGWNSPVGVCVTARVERKEVSWKYIKATRKEWRTISLLKEFPEVKRKFRIPTLWVKICFFHFLRGCSLIELNLVSSRRSEKSGHLHNLMTYRRSSCAMF